MKTLPEPTDALAAIRRLSLDDVEKRLADLDAERAALALLRRSLAARERVRRKQQSRQTAGVQR